MNRVDATDPTAPDLTWCGLRVRADLPLPDLPIWRGGDRPVDLRVRVGSVPERLENPACSLPLLQVGADGRCRFALPRVAAYLVSADGREVVIAPAGGAGNAEIRTFLFGTVLAIVCHRRGLLPLHACCVRVGDKAIAFAGDSGVGKSTLAATLWARGYELLSDDVTVVDTQAPGGPMALPALPSINLWRDALERLGHAKDGLEEVRPALPKYHLPLKTGFCTTALPLARLVYLEGDETASPDPHLVPATRSLEKLPSVLYRPRLMLRLGTQPQQMRQFLRLISAVGGLRAMRRPRGPTGQAAIDTLLRDLES